MRHLCLVSVFPAIDNHQLSLCMKKSSAVCQQETEQSIAVNGTNSNMSLSHQKKPPTHLKNICVCHTFKKFSVLYITLKQPFSLGLWSCRVGVKSQ